MFREMDRFRTFVRSMRKMKRRRRRIELKEPVRRTDVFIGDPLERRQITLRRVHEGRKRKRKRKRTRTYLHAHAYRRARVHAHAHMTERTRHIDKTFNCTKRKRRTVATVKYQSRSEKIREDQSRAERN